VGEGPDALAHIAATLPRHGVTAFCPTLVSRPPGGYRRAAAALREAAPAPPPGAARVLGVHLEGPFLAPSRAGAHDPGALRDPDPGAVDELLALVRPAIVTLAPERPGALAAIRRIAAAGAVAAIGHTEADAAAGRAALDAGARLVTHALNAMRGIESRAPSALAAALADPRPYVSLIGDGVHVAPEVAAVIARAAGPRLVLVSDAVAAAGRPAGRYALGGRAVVSDGLRVERDGRLAGSAAALDRGPATLAAAGIGPAEALHAATVAPRTLLGLADEPGDRVALDPGLRPRLTIIGGRVAYAAGDLPFDVPDPVASSSSRR
jgi:N-acetylglucosamine-6-phosphate deacetylase